MKSSKIIKYTFFSLLFILPPCAQAVPDITPAKVVPSPQQIAYQEMELIGFVHFTVNTFTDKEWGFGDEDPAVFDPTEFDANQWTKIASEIDMRQLILTTKHHDGFCLWPTKFTDHSIKNIPWRNGKGDIVKEFTIACNNYNLKTGLYLSPWDRNHDGYGTPNYIAYYRNQLLELLTQYGTVSEIWFDGANGGTGYYGGANEERRIDRKTYYDWPETWALVKQLQPDIMIFSDKGPDVRWSGNEAGYAGETNWSMINSDRITIGAAPVEYLNTGDPDGRNWVVTECDVSIRPGWFYHEKEDSLVKTPQQLVDIYYKSVGRNGVLLLNIPPDKRGRFHENDINALKEFRRILDETFMTNIALGKRIIANNWRLKHPYFSPANLLDDDSETYWATDDGVDAAVLEIDLAKGVTFDRAMLREPIRFGQRIAAFSIEGLVNGSWIEFAQGTTIGYKRLLRFASITASKVRIRIMKSYNIPALSGFGLYKASELETTSDRRH